MPRVPDAVWSEVCRLVEDLSRGEYDAIHARGQCPRCTPAELRAAVEQYGRKLTPLPDVARELCDIYETGPTTFALDVPLWTVEEGRSDLTLQIDATLAHNTMTTVTISNLHVL